MRPPLEAAELARRQRRRRCRRAAPRCAGSLGRRGARRQIKIEPRNQRRTGSASSHTAAATRATPTPQAWAAAISLS